MTARTEKFSELQLAAFRLSPVLWVTRALGVTPAPFQAQILRSPPGSQIIALTSRQAGKTQVAAWAVSHEAVFRPGTLSVVGCPSQRQAAELVRRAKAALIDHGAMLKVDNTFGLETREGSRVVALPGDEATARGLSVDGIVVADEAARLTPDMIAALRPMRARFPSSRFLMVSTAWSRTDEFWKVWESDDPSWIRIKALADNGMLYSEAFLASERAMLGDTAYRREYLGEPIGHGASPFDWSLYDKATAKHEPRVPPGPAFLPTADAVRSTSNPFKELQLSK